MLIYQMPGYSGTSQASGGLHLSVFCIYTVGIVITFDNFGSTDLLGRSAHWECVDLPLDWFQHCDALIYLLFSCFFTYQLLLALRFGDLY